MRINALIDDVDVVERIRKHLKVWDPQPDTITPAGPDPPLPQGEALSLTYHPVPDIAHKKARYKTGLLMLGSGGRIAFGASRLSYVGRLAGLGLNLLRRTQPYLNSKNKKADPLSRAGPFCFGSGGRI